MRRRTRRRIAVGVGVVAALILTAAVVWTFFRTPLLELIPTPPIVITEKDAGRTVDLTPGQRLEVRLPSNSNSGSKWRVGIPLSFMLFDGRMTFTGSPNAENVGDGYQSMTLLVTGTGTGPLFLDYIPDDNQNTLTPERSFSVIVSAH